MRLKVTKSKNAASLYVIKSVYNSKTQSNSSKIVEKLGTEIELREKLNGADPYEWAKEYIKTLNEKEKQQKREILVPFKQSKLIDKGEQHSFNGGYLFLQKIYHELKLDKICKDISKKYQFDFDLDAILSRLIYGRVIFPASKLATYTLSKKFIEQPQFDLHQIYRALEFLAKETDFIQSSLYENSLKISKRNTGVLFYDCTNYFFEIAKLRALRLLFNTLAKEYNHELECYIIATPTKRNKTLYDYNVNMLRTTTECMSAILGGADAVANLAYDAIYHKDNEFGDRISRNQLLVLKHESYFDKVNNPADGAYYIETLTEQLAEKALELFKDIEKNGGLISQLIDGTIQRKINENAQKEQELFDSGKEVLLGTNKYPNKNDQMKNDLELYPFVKQNARKTLITPIIEKRLAEKLEQERLASE